MAGPMIGPAGMRIITLLVGTPPQTVADLVDATGVTRTAITGQLAELIAAGLVARSTERQPGRGRPRHVYSATTAALSCVFTNHHQAMVPAIWKAIQAYGGPSLTSEILRRVSRGLADRYRGRITAKSAAQRLVQFAELLREEGALVEVVKEGGRVTMHKRSCPFIGMLDDERTVCCVDERMTAELIGRSVRRSSYRLAGAPCCVFEVEGSG